MVTAEKAIDKYKTVLSELGVDQTQYRFKIDNGLIRVGHVVGPGTDHVQWSMMRYSPDDFLRVAEMRRLDVPPSRKVGNRFVPVDR